jgi:Xaa-Pro aminopeptidase
VEKIADEVLKDRVRIVKQDLRNAGLDALLLYATGSVLGNRSATHPYLRYLCDFDAHNTAAVLIVRPDNEPVLLTGTRFHVRPRVAETRLWFSDVHHVEPKAFGSRAAALLRDFGVNTGRIAVIGHEDMPAPVWADLTGGLSGVEWIHDFSEHIDRHRVRKEHAELAFHRRAAGICDQMFATLAEAVQTGRPGFQIKAAMEHTARDAGCDYVDTWLTAAPEADYFRYYSEECLRIPQEGDQLLSGMMLTYDGHWGHAVRTGSVGVALPKHRRLYDICREMFEAGLKALRPGEDLCLVNDAMDGVLHRYYSDDEVLRTRSGHGLGYAYEDPVVSLAFPNAWEREPGKPRSAIETVPGMLLELHPHFFVPGLGGAMIGDMVLVTQTGYELLTRYPRELIAW